MLYQQLTPSLELLAAASWSAVGVVMYWCMEGTVIMYEMLTSPLTQAAMAQFVRGKRAAEVKTRATQVCRVYHYILWQKNKKKTVILQKTLSSSSNFRFSVRVRPARLG